MNCKVCNQEKTKTPVSRGNCTRFVDENNRLWNGRVCPDCYKIYNKERMRFKRKSDKLTVDSETIIID
jgi:predicted secreted protein